MLYSKYLIEIAVVLYIKYIPLPKMLHFGITYADMYTKASFFNFISKLHPCHLCYILLNPIASSYGTTQMQVDTIASILAWVCTYVGKYLNS